MRAAPPSIWSGSLESAVAMRGGIGRTAISEAQQLDRRLGVIITTAMGPTGDLHAVYATTQTGHAVSSPGYIRQTARIRLP